MPKAVSFVQLRGTMFETTFRMVPGIGNVSSAKSSLDRERFYANPNFQRTWENNAEFAQASEANKLLRVGINPTANARSSNLIQRLQRKLVEITKTDSVHVRGERVVSAGDLNLLENFQWNDLAPFGSVFYAPYTTTIDRVTGELTWDIPAFVPINFTALPTGLAPGETPYFKLKACGCEVDFDNLTILTDVQSSGFLPRDSSATSPLTLTATVSAGSTLPLILVIAIEWYIETNGVKYLLNNEAFEGMMIAKVDV